MCKGLGLGCNFRSLQNVGNFAVDVAINFKADKATHHTTIMYPSIATAKKMKALKCPTLCSETFNTKLMYFRSLPLCLPSPSAHSSLSLFHTHRLTCSSCDWAVMMRVGGGGWVELGHSVDFGIEEVLLLLVWMLLVLFDDFLQFREQVLETVTSFTTSLSFPAQSASQLALKKTLSLHTGH